MAVKTVISPRNYLKVRRRPGEDRNWREADHRYNEQFRNEDVSQAAIKAKLQ